MWGRRIETYKGKRKTEESMGILPFRRGDTSGGGGGTLEIKKGIRRGRVRYKMNIVQSVS